MRLLHLSDVHGTPMGQEVLPRLVRELEVDAVVLTGDITHFGPPEYASELASSCDVPMLAVLGNCDPPEVADALAEAGARVLHGRGDVLGGLKFFGLGGLVGGGVHAGLKLSEEEARRILMGSGKVDVLLTHVPPYGILDEVASLHIGSRGIREAVRALRPRFHLFGHVHEARGVLQSTTIFVNPGPFKDGFYAFLDASSAAVKLLREEGF